MTSWTELARDGMRCGADGQTPWLVHVLDGTYGAIVAASDYACSVPEQVRTYASATRTFDALGTDGYGRSDTRAERRQYFYVDAAAIVARAKRRLGV